MMIPPKGATEEGTLQFRKSFKEQVHPDKFRNLQEFAVSSLAVGTYLGHYDDEVDRLYEEAIEKALTRGCNLIDTAINYRCQRSERLIGRSLRSLFDKKRVSRHQIVVATKGGFIPFDLKPPDNLSSYIRKNWIEPGIIADGDIVANCHCLHPDFIRMQIDQSLANLGLDTIDLYYLHNPETQLPVLGPDLFYERLSQVFEVMEEAARKGKIQYYGLATWTAFREPKEIIENISLEKVVGIARKVAGDEHRFRAIQLPYNLAMLEAIGVHGQTLEGKSSPIIPVAASLGLAVMISAPLLQGQLLHLPQAILKPMPGRLSPAQKALQFVVSTPSVTAAMVGMKSKEHVEENLKLFCEPNWDLETLQKICDLVVKR